MQDPSKKAVPAQRDISLIAEAVIDAPPQRLQDIERWAPGVVLTLAAPVNSDRVHLRVGGRTVARGRLATVGDTLAFEIVELYD